MTLLLLCFSQVLSPGLLVVWHFQGLRPHSVFRVDSAIDICVPNRLHGRGEGRGGGGGLIDVAGRSHGCFLPIPAAVRQHAPFWACIVYAQSDTIPVSCDLACQGVAALLKAPSAHAECVCMWGGGVTFIDVPFRNIVNLASSSSQVYIYILCWTSLHSREVLIPVSQD